MDFLSSYIPPSPTRFTPRGNEAKFEDLPALRSPCNERQLENMKSGDFGEVRRLRGGLEKKTSKVQFLAPLSEDGESLQSIKLTPKARSLKEQDVRTREVQAATRGPKSKKKRSDHGTKDKINNIFGFKFRRPGSQSDSEQ